MEERREDALNLYSGKNSRDSFLRDKSRNRSLCMLFRGIKEI